MKVIFLIFIYPLAINLGAQEKSNYFIVSTEFESFFIQGTRTSIVIPENACFEIVAENHITEGEKFMIVHVLDEMENGCGVLIFKKNGGQINYDVVQMERERYYSNSNCCIFVEELNGQLYFWDLTTDFDDIKDYDCANDSQTDPTGLPFNIPRYYIFNPELGIVETIMLKNNCDKLIQDGKLNCE